jgi:hypothetical protein
MKTFILFFPILFITQISAQSPWPETGTKWWYFGGDPLYGPRQMILEAVGEEIFEGQLSQKIERTDVDFSGNAISNGSFYAYQQNDSVFVYNEMWQDYILMFDYTAEVGDTLILHNPTSRTGPDSLFFNYVYKIDSLDHCETGLKVKSWHLEHQRGFAEYQEILMQEYFIFPFDLYTWYGFGDADKYLHCFEDSEHDIDCSAYYGYEDEPCYGKPSAVGDADLITDISLCPNPAIDKIWLAIPGSFNNLRYTISDALGKEIASGYINAHHQVIELGAIQSGIYFLSFPGEKIQVQKFTVQL